MDNAADPIPGISPSLDTPAEVVESQFSNFKSQISNLKSSSLTGLLFIGDPHLASRAPGFRKDDYPRAILAKLRWALEYACRERLVPVLLGDLFDFPRDNANWMLVELLSLFSACPGGCVLAVSGNHDCKENELGENDTLSVLVAAGHVRLLDRGPWHGEISGCPVIIGGTCWGQMLPESFDRPATPARVFWVTHHNLRFPGYEENATFGCREIPGIDVAVNGHIHRCLGDVIAGGTTWINPGNIARVKRSDVSRDHVPSVLRIDLAADRTWTRERITVPHETYDDVFHAQISSIDSRIADSPFILQLAELESIRTQSGAGLRAFLDANLPQFGERVAAEINSLAMEVLKDAG